METNNFNPVEVIDGLIGDFQAIRHGMQPSKRVAATMVIYALETAKKSVLWFYAQGEGWH